MILSTPFFAQSSYSDNLIRREAFSTSGCSAPTPLQNSFMPAPVPVASMIGDLIDGFDLASESAIALAKG